MRIEFSLTKREVAALLKDVGRIDALDGPESGIDWPYGVRKSQARTVAEFKLIGALLHAQRTTADGEQR